MFTFKGLISLFINLLPQALIFIFISGCTNSSTTLFESLPSHHTGIYFNNNVIENDSINPIDQEFMYQGGGIAVGDFNGDSLPDLYFTGSMVSNKLYINKGGFVFEDVTDLSGTGCEGFWCSGVSTVDINQDGLLDIYVCTLIKNNSGRQTNFLYINQGVNKDGIPVFKEEAEAYGLADASVCIQANFFDYDRDGDLDMYLLNTKLVQRDAHYFTIGFNSNIGDTVAIDADKLYRNDWNDSLGHPVFTDVSKESGIYHRGYGLGLITADFNNDEWPDVYVANDFLGNDHLYINQQDGTFKEQLNLYFKHTSMNAMGTDFADINNDGLPDLITVDMDPFDNFRKKKNMGGNNYFLYQNFKQGNYMYQYVRNTLQLNMGKKPESNEHIFSEIGFLAGVAETDWSWNPSLADFDNDGWRDLIITNGYPRDVTDHDFGMFKVLKGHVATKQELIAQIPAIKIGNFAFRNKNGYQFEHVSTNWGLDKPSFSNGAVYADLDNDGDLDYVINNINDEASVFRNTTNDDPKTKRNFIKIRLKGTAFNPAGIGAQICLFTKDGKQQYENTPYRGYMSSQGTDAFFGLGNNSMVDSVLIIWPDGKRQKLDKVDANQLLQIEYSPESFVSKIIPETKPPSFQNVSAPFNILFRHQEADHIDFNTQRLLPRKLSQSGPPLAVGDINGDGLEDMIVGGTGDFQAAIFLQQVNGSFEKRLLPYDTGKDARRPEHCALLLFDANMDGFADLYIATGSNEWPDGSPSYRDLFYLNDGKGNFTRQHDVIPLINSSNGCVRAADFDNDGDLDLFIGGRSIPNQYPMPASSYILRNDTKDGKVKFTDVTEKIAPMLQHVGLICDVLWTDFDQDGETDLLLAGEWQSLIFLKQDKGVFRDVSKATTISGIKGWWNSLSAADLDSDGDMDYIVGNLGLNSYYRADIKYPTRIYAGDFDNNGTWDIIPTLYLPNAKGKLEEFPAHGRDEVVEQMPVLKKKYYFYKDFGKATIRDLLTEVNLKQALVLEANNFSNGWLRNEGEGKFTFIPFEIQAQTAPMFGIQVADVNQDGNPDIIAVGNDFGTEVRIGHYDASNGWVMLGNGKGGFRYLTPSESGFYVPGNAKALAWLQKSNGRMHLVATQNQDSIRTFEITPMVKWLDINKHQYSHVIFNLKDGRKQMVENNRGATFATQSSKMIPIPALTQKIGFYSRGKLELELSIEELEKRNFKL